MKWTFFINMAVNFLKTAATALEADTDPNKEIIGEGLAYAADFIEWLISGRKGSVPAVPGSLKK